MLTGVRTLSATSSLSYADNGQVVSDGNVHLTASSAANLGGVTTQTTGTGTYSLGADCSGLAHVSNANGTIDYMLVLVQDGQIGLFLVSDAGLIGVKHYCLSADKVVVFAPPQRDSGKRPV